MSGTKRFLELLTILTLVGTLHAADETSPDPPRLACGDDGGQPPPNRVNSTQRLQDLRAVMAGARYDIQAYLVPMDDEHQSEYVAPADARVQYICGFSGSAGLAVVTRDSAAFWTDGRYYLQAEHELDCNWQLMRNTSDPKPPSEVEWLTAALRRGDAVGADPRLLPAHDWLHLDARLKEAGIQLKLVYENLVDLVWTEDQPARSTEPIQVHNLTYAGRSWQQKVADVLDVMEEEQVDVLLVTALDEVAWLLNLRGSDIPHTPVFRSYAVVDRVGVHAWLEPEKVTDAVREHLHSDGCLAGHDCVQLHSYYEVLYNFGKLLREEWQTWDRTNVLIPSGSAFIDGASFSFYNQVPASSRVFKPSPLEKLKGVKNAVEVEGMKAAHKRDSLAVCQFLAFLEKEIAAGREWDELSAAARLQLFRAQQQLFRGSSFATISAFGSNAAVIHYTPSNATARRIDTSATYLLDSGGQYLDGTTDVTRTMHYGLPTDFQREAYTRVLMGAIDLARLVVSAGVKDIHLGILARRPLFAAGLNYRHGTGHGIGAYLSVHEGPTLISPRSSGHVMEPGQFFSDEPGYYHDGEFGVRLETILLVKEVDTKFEFDGPYLAFEPVTLVPFETNLIQPDLMTAEQLQWLSEYHARVEREIGSLLEEEGDTDTLQWLRRRTAPLHRQEAEQVKTAASTVYSPNSASQSGRTLLVALVSSCCVLLSLLSTL